MNKNISKKITLKTIKSYDILNESKKTSKPYINFYDFLNDYFKDAESTNLSKYVTNK